MSIGIYGQASWRDPWHEKAKDVRRSAIHQAPDMASRRILVVEDELLIALEIDTILSDAGFEVLGPAGSNAEALRLIEQRCPDAALLDVNLGGHTVQDVAERLLAEDIPFAFVTAYGPENLPRPFRSIPVVSKPFVDRQLLQAAQNLVDAPSG